MRNPALAAYATAERQRRRRYAKESRALFARFEADTPSWLRDEIDRLVRAQLSSGSWWRKDFLHIAAVNVEPLARLNWITDAYNLTPSDPAPAFEAFRGVTPNGTSSYYSTGFNPAKAGGLFSLNTAHLMAWHRTAVTGYDFGNTNSRITRPGTASVYARTNNTSDLTAAGTYTTHKGWNRTASNAVQMFIAGAAIGNPATAAPTALTSFAFGIGRTSATEFGSNQFSIGHGGRELTPAMIASDYDAFRVFMLAVGAAA